MGGQGLCPLVLGVFSAFQVAGPCPFSPSVPWSPGPRRSRDLGDADNTRSWLPVSGATVTARGGRGCPDPSLLSTGGAAAPAFLAVIIAPLQSLLGPAPSSAVTGPQDTIQVPRAMHAAVGSDEPRKAIVACSRRCGFVY